MTSFLSSTNLNSQTRRQKQAQAEETSAKISLLVAAAVVETSKTIRTAGATSRTTRTKTLQAWV